MAGAIGGKVVLTCNCGGKGEKNDKHDFLNHNIIKNRGGRNKSWILLKSHIYLLF